MVTATEFCILEDAANRYLTENDYGVPEIEAVMAKIFGNNRKGTKAIAWAQYWTKLNIYEERVRDGDHGQVPKVRQVLSNYTRLKNISVDAT